MMSFKRLLQKYIFPQQLFSSLLIESCVICEVSWLKDKVCIYCRLTGAETTSIYLLRSEATIHQSPGSPTLGFVPELLIRWPYFDPQ